MKKLFAIFVLCVFSAWASAKSAVEELGCHYLEDSEYVDSDPCLYLKNKEFKVIFNPEYYDQKVSETETFHLIAINGKVSRLKLVSTTDYLSKDPRSASAIDIKGDSHFSVYKTDNIKVEYKKTVINDSCNEKSDKGIYEGVEKCCYSTYKVNIKLIINGKSHVFSLNHEEGGG